LSAGFMGERFWDKLRDNGFYFFYDSK
jgi:hypothetical protein